MNENWKPIAESDRYLVSDLGNFWDKKKERFISKRVRPHHQTGKLCVLITFILDGKQRTKSIAALMLSAFKRLPNPNECAGYKDGNVTNLILSNLEWVNNPRKGGKVSEEAAEKIRQALSNGTSAATAAAEFGVSAGSVYAIKSGFRSPNAKLRHRRALGISVPKLKNRKVRSIETIAKPEQPAKQPIGIFDIPQLTGEEWRPVFGMSRYMVSNCGRLWDAVTSRIVRPDKSLSKIRPTVKLKHDGITYTKSVALAVLQAFRWPLDSKGRIGYKDGNEWNVRLSNLGWTTLPVGVSPAVAARVKRYLNQGLIIFDAAQRTGLSIGIVFAIKHGCCRADLVCVKRIKAERSGRFYYDPELIIA